MVDRTLRRIFILSGIVLLLWVLYLLKPVVIPFVVAFFMAYLFSPLVEQFCKVGLPRWLSISLVFIGIGIALTLAVWYIIPLVWKQLMIARDSIPVGINWINSTFLPWVSSTFNIEEMEIDTSHMSSIVMDYVQTNYSADSIQAMLLRVAQSGLNFIQIGGTVVLIPIIAFYFLLDWQRMLDSLRRLIPRPYEQSTLAVVQECHSVLGAFVKGQFLVMILLGVVYATGLQLIGLEVGLIIGMVAGLASIIPYLGFAVGIVAAIIATFLQFGIDWMQLVLVLVVFMIGQAVEGYILQPFLLGDKIGLSPVAVLENYGQLWHVEKAFRISKTDLRIRPMYHRRRGRIEAHVLIAFVAYTIYKDLERRLAEAHIALSPQRVAELTQTMYEMTFRLPDDPEIHHTLLQMDPDQQRVYDLLH